MSNKLAKREQTSTGIATREELLTKYSVPQCIKKFRHANTPAKAAEEKVPTLGMIKRNHSEDTVLAYIEMWIISLNDFINATRSMSQEQMQETAMLIFQDYPYLKLSDINLVFTKAKKGEYGKIYESLDGMKILQWFRDYTNERAESVLQKSIDTDKTEKQFEQLPRQTQKGKEELKKIGDVAHQTKLQKMKDKYSKNNE